MPVPRVSVLLATYRPRPDWLQQAIASVLAQTFRDYELLVLDDSNLPSVNAIANSYKDSRIRYLVGPGKGPGYNHSFGIHQARAPLISIINHDDAWAPSLLESLFKAYASVPGAVIAFSDHSVMNESGQVDDSRSDRVTKEWKRDSLVEGIHQPFQRLALVDGAVCLCVSGLFSREIAVDLDPRSDRYYDRYLAYLLSRDGHAAVYVPERLASWRESSENLTSRRSVRASVTRLWLAWQFFSDPRLSHLRRALGSDLLHSLRGVIGALRDLPMRLTKRADVS